MSPSVLLQYYDNVEALELAARAAHQNDKANVAADLMIDACRNDQFQNTARIQRAVAALLAAGRLFECIDLLETAVETRPDQHVLRRMLFQMCWGVEDRPRSSPHGRYLIRQRQFDLDLLLEMSDTEARSESSQSLIEIAERQPRDKRPLIAEARVRFDDGDLDRAAEILQQILQDAHDDAPSLALLCRVFVDDGRDNEFQQLVADVPESIQDHAFYWLALGDWCQKQNQPTHAARSYWEAVRRDDAIRESWLKLSMSLALVGQQHGLTDEQINALDSRVRLLTRFRHLRARFVKAGKTSSNDLVEMAIVQKQLGRLWYAEAWLSIATTLPGDGTQRAKQVRDETVKLLRRDTPWQLVNSHPEVNIDLSHLPLPVIGSAVNERKPTSSHPTVAVADPGNIQLENQAERRQLRFHGRTGDELHQPGIMHYQTLGCGGGAIDYDLDGWNDIYLVAAGGKPSQRDSIENSLWRNLEGTLDNVTSASATGDPGFGQGVAVGDVNEDGFPDLLVLNYGPNVLLINNGDGSFSDESHRLDQKVSSVEWSSSGAIADLDGDGLNDLTILNYGQGLDPVTKECRQESTALVRACSPLMFPGARDCFLQGSLTGEFTDQTDNWSANPDVLGRGLGICVGSFDSQPGLDVFIANDLTSNHYWSRATGNAFGLRESAVLRGLGSSERSPGQGSMGMTAADLDRDGDVDFFITNFLGESNTYHEQVNNGLWRDQTTTQGLHASSLPFVGFGTEVIDFDNDGHLEIVITNGHIDTYPGEDAAPYAQLPLVYQRRPAGDYQLVTDRIQGEYLQTPHVGRALWTVDVNRDGLTDFVVTHQTEPVALLVNQTEDTGNWIEIQLSGRQCSRDAIGSVVHASIANTRWTIPMTSGDGYLCSNEKVIRIGLGKRGILDDQHKSCEVTVCWPDGTHQTFQSLAINRAWLLTEGDPNAFELSHPGSPR
ncbi:MAG: FG-GAP-like repeat-containing protein [Rhodopirellula sp. JB044]|uniref:FG-GAP-like repeat-containing protein n=1 Tax=Rhodopirellula sp. JB044 TaxID=3342844 RepID=UPI00370C0B60